MILIRIADVPKSDSKRKSHRSPITAIAMQSSEAFAAWLAFGQICATIVHCGCPSPISKCTNTAEATLTR